jgi:hypothetical protein
MWSSLLLPVIFGYLFKRYMETAGQREGQLAQPHGDRAARQRFLMQTGYRVLGMESAPLQAQAEVISAEGLFGGRPLLRAIGEDRLIFYDHRSADVAAWGAPWGRAAWVLELDRPTQVQWSLVRRELVGGIAPGRRPFTQPKMRLAGLGFRAWHNAFASDAEAVSRILATPDVRNAISACASLDLHVEEHRVVFMDPKLRNLVSGSGGVLTSMLLNEDLDSRLDLEIVAHERIAEMLQRVAQLSREDPHG